MKQTTENKTSKILFLNPKSTNPLPKTLELKKTIKLTTALISLNMLVLSTWNQSPSKLNQTLRILLYFQIKMKIWTSMMIPLINKTEKQSWKNWKISSQKLNKISWRSLGWTLRTRRTLTKVTWILRKGHLMMRTIQNLTFKMSPKLTFRTACYLTCKT